MASSAAPKHLATACLPRAVCQLQQVSKMLAGRHVLNQIDLTICNGERVALVGPNGAGKTTLLRCMAAATRPTSGRIDWFHNGTSVTRHRKSHIGVVAHDTRLYPDLTVQENLLFAARMCGLPAASDRTTTWLERCGLVASAMRRTHELSRGMQQRLAVARSLIHEPRLVLLDEPFNGLDASGSSWLCSLLLEIAASERAIVFVTHEPRWVSALATRQFVLEHGQLKHLPQDNASHPEHHDIRAAA